MGKAIPLLIIGVVLLLLGAVWASQGAGMMGGSSLMDNNPTFIYLGGAVAVVGIALIAFGAASKPKVKAPVATPGA